MKKNASLRKEMHEEKRLSLRKEEHEEKRLSLRKEAPRERPLPLRKEAHEEKHLSLRKEAPRERPLPLRKEAHEEKHLSLRKEAPRERPLPLRKEAHEEKRLSLSTEVRAEKRLSLRKGALKRKCARFQQPLTHEEKRLLYAELVVDDKNRVIWCPVRKAGTTTWRIVMLILMGKFSTVKEALDHIMKNDFQYVTRLSDKYLNNEDIEYRLNTYTKFMAYREPLGRVVSDYRQIRLCDTPFRKSMCKRILRHNNIRIQSSNNNVSIVLPEITFPQFVNFITRFNEKRHYIDLDIHWRPTHLICHPCHIDYDYLVDFSSPGVVDESAYVLDALGAPSWLQLPQENRSGNETKFTFLSQLSPAQFERLSSQYDDDYEIFGYQKLI
ncbi:carbohydrate sulfotransferase 8-like [Corticium candelabrum]|uniref:carbohydrate sulfotransferase 8-like n=1 Tax=Corticium candelabrum TaxID=121492 RepID=UPI002E258A09|nr:carbohydrate sulfotransferase 8-like [Corticium candelabrum]